jgi:hypothetical protein
MSAYIPAAYGTCCCSLVAIVEGQRAHASCIPQSGRAAFETKDRWSAGRADRCRGGGYLEVEVSDASGGGFQCGVQCSVPGSRLNSEV